MSAKPKHYSKRGERAAVKRPAECGTRQSRSRSNNRPVSGESGSPALPSFSPVDSEKPRVRRGRPRAFTHESLATYARAYDGSVKTARGLQNKAYMVNAIKELGFRPCFAWLGLGDEKAFKAGKAKLRTTILAELGRIPHPDIRRIMAAHVCKEKPPTARIAVALLRNRRRRGVGAASSLAEKFMGELWAILKRFLRSSGDFTLEEAAKAFQLAQLNCVTNDWSAIRNRKEDFEIAVEFARKRERLAAA